MLAERATLVFDRVDVDGSVAESGQESKQYYVPHVGTAITDGPAATDAQAGADAQAVDEIPRVTRTRRGGAAPSAGLQAEPAAAVRQRVDRRWPVFVGPIGSGVATIGLVGLLAGGSAVAAWLVVAAGVVMAITAIVAAYR